MAASFLIVDEDRNFREAVAIALRLDGHEAVAAATGDEARLRLAARLFTCCVVDAHLAEADQVLETVVASGARAVATGPYPELLAAVAARHPTIATLAKPFRTLDLVRLLDDSARAAS
jgi:DNA-binding NtrC family response regulator